MNNNHVWADVVDRDRKAGLTGKLIGRYIKESIGKQTSYYIVTETKTIYCKVKHIKGLDNNPILPQIGEEGYVGRSYVEGNIRLRDRLEDIRLKRF